MQVLGEALEQFGSIWVFGILPTANSFRCKVCRHERLLTSPRYTEVSFRLASFSHLDSKTVPRAYKTADGDSHKKAASHRASNNSPTSVRQNLCTILLLIIVVNQRVSILVTVPMIGTGTGTGNLP